MEVNFDYVSIVIEIVHFKTVIINYISAFIKMGFTLLTVQNT